MYTNASSPTREPVPQRSGAADAENRRRLSIAQERTWFLEQMYGASAAQVIPLRFLLRGELDCVSLERALRLLVERHPVLRTRFELSDGMPAQQTRPPAESDLDFRIVDFSEEAVQVEARRAFDLANGPLLRAVVFRKGPAESEFLLVQHEIAADSESTCTLVRELGICYSSLRKGETAVLPEAGADYSFDGERVRSDAWEASLEYWKIRLANAPVLDLPGDRSRPEPRTPRGGQVPFALDREATAALDRFLDANGLSLAGGLMSFLQILLHRHSGQEDICTGFPVSVPSRDGAAPVLGPSVNHLVLRSDFSANASLRDFARGVERAMREAREHDLPFAALVEAVKPARSRRHTPLFQVLLDVKPPEWNRLCLAGLEAEPLAVHAGAARFDLTLAAWRTGNTVRGALEYSSDLFDEPTVRRMAGHLETLIAGASDGTRTVASMPMLTREETATLLFDWNRTSRPYPRACVHELIREQCRRTPDRVAVQCGSEELTYADLDLRSDVLASHLRHAGVIPGEVAGVCVERSADMVVAVLGVLKSGAAFVPLDPAYPSERLEYMLENSGARAVVTQRPLAGLWKTAEVEPVCLEDLPLERGSQDRAPQPAGELAYVIYTSGSTGRPKGVAVRHEGLTNFIHSMRAEPGFSESDILLAVTTLCFDIAGLELYLPLATGGRVVIATRDEARDGAKLRQIVETRGVTVLQATPATWPLLIEAGWKGDGRLKVLCGGEAMPRALAEQLLSRAGSVWNMYGPTETTVWSSVYRVRGDERAIPVGKPIANTQFYVVDRQDQPVPAGVHGELLIGGTGLAAGYFRDPEKTASRFIRNPFPGTPGERLYRTGDLVRYLPDGNVEHLGRIDNQVKVRGFRIELGEIEAVLAYHPGVRSAAVTVQADEGGDKALVAFVTRMRDATVREPELRTLLKQKLPEHMLPSAIEFLESMPQTPNGKIDRKALPFVRQPAPQAVSEGSCDLVELRLIRIWAETLGVRPASVDQSFFDLGGHSLSAARVLARIEREFGTRLPLAALFAAPTISQLAAMVRTDGKVRWPRVVTVQPHGTGLPFLFVGGGFNFLSPLARQLHEMGVDQPFLSLAHPRIEDLSGRRVQDLAAYHLETVQQIQPHGPYYLSGFCAEGVVAYEMAQRLRATGEEVAWLGLFEAENRADRRMARDLVTITATFSPSSSRLQVLRREGFVRYFRKRAVKAWRLALNYVSPRMDPMGGPDFLFDFTKLKLYRPEPYSGKAHLFRRCLDKRYYPDPLLGWGGIIADIAAFEIPGSHLGMFQEPVVEVLARHVVEGIRGSRPSETCAIAGQY